MNDCKKCKKSNLIRRKGTITILCDKCNPKEAIIYTKENDKIIKTTFTTSEILFEQPIYKFPNVGSRQLGKIKYHLESCQDNNCNDYAHEYIKQKENTN